MTEQAAYLAAPGFEAELEAEIGPVTARYGRLLLAEGPAKPAAWAQNIWHAPELLPVESIKKAAALLRARQRNWAAYGWAHHRRLKLIEGELPHVSAKPLVFGTAAPAAPLGSFTLIDPAQMLVSARCSSLFKNGEVEFVEDKTTPPNRAYLKLWEFFTVSGVRPKPGELCLDLGACPGGWSWVLATLGANVISVDKAPLAPHIAKLPNITYHAGSAFALEPKDHPPVDWLFSDIACYPERLLKLVQRWLEAGKVCNFVCTIKLQGETDHAAVQAFAAIPGSRVQHLWCNKHELTWSRPK
jgi:23S rRNA (cytidine2498-2'-O)-methyltransferase